MKTKFRFQSISLKDLPSTPICVTKSAAYVLRVAMNILFKNGYVFAKITYREYMPMLDGPLDNVLL